MKYAELRAKIRTRKKDSWFVYLLECKDGSYYCGITKNISRRIDEHNSGKGAKYTRGRGPVRLIATCDADSMSQALKIEAEVKKQRKKNKVQFLQNYQKKK